MLPVLLFLSLCISVNADSLKFLAFGDWGGQPNDPYTTQVQLQVASQMGEVASSFQSQFVLAMGDNFYDSGVTDVDSPRFQHTFEQVYTAQSLQTPFYVIAGNHDHNGNVSAQIAYSQVSSRWIFPSEWYTKIFQLPGTKTTVQIVFFDTVVFTGKWPKRAAQPLGPPNLRLADEQYEWIQETLANSTADWLFVVGHYPVWSVAEHGPTASLVEYIRPLLQQYKVAAYFNGHDHSLQHLREDDTDVDYYLSGAAHDIDLSLAHKHKVPKNSLKFHWPSDDDSHGGFISVEVQDANNMSVVYYSDDGTVLYTHSKTNPRKSQ